MIKVYVAGPYSAYNVVDVLKNIGRGEKACAELFKEGFAPFCPWHDKSFVINRPEDSFSVKQFYDYSIEWLRVSDCVFLLPGWEDSKGTLAEIKIAETECNIPIFDSLSNMKNYYQQKG